MSTMMVQMILIVFNAILLGNLFFYIKLLLKYSLECDAGLATDCSSCNSSDFRELNTTGECTCISGYYEYNDGTNDPYCLQCYSSW